MEELNSFEHRIGIRLAKASRSILLERLDMVTLSGLFSHCSGNQKAESRKNLSKEKHST